jgi:hypothetical protein
MSSSCEIWKILSQEFSINVTGSIANTSRHQGLPEHHAEGKPAQQGTREILQKRKQQLLDKLRARTTTMKQKLAGMSQSGQVSNLEADTRPTAQLEMVGPPSPGTILDKCLAQAHKLNTRMDKLSAEAAAYQNNASNSEPATNAPWKRTEKHQTLDATEPATKPQAVQEMAKCSNNLPAASPQLSSSSPHASLNAVRSSAVRSTQQLIQDNKPYR